VGEVNEKSSSKRGSSLGHLLSRLVITNKMRDRPFSLFLRIFSGRHEFFRVEKELRTTTFRFQPHLTGLVMFFEPFTFADCLFPKGTQVICHQRKDHFFDSLW